MERRSTTCFALALLLAAPALAVDPTVRSGTEVTIDLSKVDATPGFKRLDVAAGTVVVLIQNKVPAARKYSVKARVIRDLSPGISVPEGLNFGSVIQAVQNATPQLHAMAPPAEAAAAPLAECTALGSPFAALKSAKTEQDVPPLVKALQAQVKKCDEDLGTRLLRIRCEAAPQDPLCLQLLAPLEKSLLDCRTLIGKTSEKLEIPIEENEDLEVLITSTAAEDPTSVVNWSYRFVTPGDRRWFVSYGFAVTEDDSESYFTRQVEGEAGSFEVLKENDSREETLIPAVFFNAHLGKARSFDVLAAGGLGVNSDTVSIFAGVGLSVYKNLSLLVGASVRATDRLDGKYEIGQILGENLDGDALTDETYKTYLFVSLGFRFGGAPSTHLPRD